MKHRRTGSLINRWSISIFVIGLLLSAASAYIVNQHNHQRIKDAVIAAANEASSAIMDRLSIYQYGLSSTRGAVLASGYQNLTQEIFRRSSLTHDINTKFPGARGFGFIERVPKEKESEFVQHARTLVSPDFAIRQLTPHDNERLVIKFIEPSDRNSQAIGLDIASETKRHEAALAAMRSGEPRLTSPITLVHATESPQQSFLLIAPVYNTEIQENTPAERENATIGWVYAPLLIDDVLTGIRIDNTLTHLALFDVSIPGQKVAFNASDYDGLDIIFTHSLQREVYGRRWLIEFSVHPRFVDELNLLSPTALALPGALISLLLAALIATLRLGNEREKQIFAEKTHMAAIVESSTDGIIGLTLNNRITSWNKGAEQIFGYTAEQALGNYLSDLIVPDNLRQEEISILSRIKDGEQIQHFETLLLCENGRTVDVSITMSPLLNSKRKIVGASKTVRDISAQKRNEKRILELNATLEQQVEQRVAELNALNLIFSNVLNAASEVSIIASDNKGTITLFNRGAERLLGYAAADIVGKCTLTLFHLEDEIRLRSAELTKEYGFPVEGLRTLVHKSVIEGAETQEWTYVRKDGSHCTVSLSVTTIRNETQHIIGHLGVAIDISAHKETLGSLAESLELTRAILDTAVQPIISIDVYGIVRSINSAGIKTFGYSSDEIIGQNIKILMPEPHHSAHDGYIARFLREKTSRIMGAARGIIAKRKDGSLFPAHLSVGMMESAGQLMFVGIFADISAQQQQHNELIAARDQMILASEVAELGIWTWTLSTNLLLCNERTYEIYELPRSLREQGLHYDHWRMRVHPDDIESVEASINNATAGIDSFNSVFRIILSGGRIRYIQAAGQIERDIKGQSVRMTGISRDITTQRELETHLRLAKEQADTANATKSSFLANMSHELRTPMNAVLGMLQLVQKTSLDSRQLDYVTKAYSAGKSLLVLLNDILDYSKIEAGKLELDAHSFSLETLMRDLAIVLTGNNYSENVEVIFDIDPNLPTHLIGDSLRLKQVLINLASNALKFTSQGHVIVSVSELERSHESAQLQIAVTDTGIGISDEQRKRIFQGFSQAEASTSRRFGGSGLGLVISKRLTELMGSEIQLISEPGKGSRFWFDITLRIAQHITTKTITDVVPKPLRVLIADDNALSREILTSAMRELGCLASCANNGLDVVEQVREANSRGEAYDVLLMDWKMPGLDGLSAAQLIKQENNSPSPIVIMISAYDKELLTDMHTQDNVPFADILTKPITPLQLMESLQRVLTAPAQEITIQPPSKESDQRLKGLHLLVVEDNALNRQVAQIMLSDEGATVDLAEGGLEGVSRVLAASERYDVLIMDMQMPDIDGLEATRRIRADGRFNDLPILAMTANASLTDRQACLAAGMNEHIGKPFDLDHLVSLILALKNNKPMPISDIKQIKPPIESVISSEETIKRRFGHRVAIYHSLLTGFQTEISHLLDSLDAHISQQNVSATIAVMHTIKGSAGLMNASVLSSRSSVIEQQLKTQGAAAMHTILNDQIVQELHQLLALSVEQLHAIVNTPLTDTRATTDQTS